jgi:hypothetical protein
MPLPKISQNEIEKMHAVPRQGASGEAPVIGIPISLGDEKANVEKPRAQACTDGGVAEPGQIIPKNVKAEALTALHEALKADKALWSKELGKYYTEPDHATRLRAAELVLAYAEGRPVERKLTLTGSAGGGFDERIAQLCATPEGLRIAISLGIIAEESNDIRKDAKNQKKKSEKALHSLNKLENDQSAVSQKREIHKAKSVSE